MTREVESLKDLISPVSVEDFFANYWEKTYLHIRNQPGRFSEYFSMSHIDRWLSSVRSGQADSILIASPEGAEKQVDRYRPQDLGVESAYASFGKGFSLVFNHLEDWPSLQGLTKALGRVFHADIGINAYLTPKGGRTFPIHTDEHDVLVLHLEGEKVWRLHEFSLLQLPLSQKKNFKFTEEWYNRTQTPQLAEVRLAPGDVLFIPRGMPHYAVAQEAACLHLTISIVSLYWMDFLKFAAEYAAIRSPAVRRSLPPGFVGDEQLTEQMRKDFSEVMRAFQETVSFDEVVSAIKRNRVAYQGYPSDGQFAELLDLEVQDDSLVERRRDVLCYVDQMFDTERKPHSAIFFGSQYVKGPLGIRRALEFVRDNETFRVSQIPGLDAKGRVTLARRLLVEGLLRRCRAPVPSEALEPALA